MGNEELLAKVDQAVNSCRQCRLYRTRSRAVPGEGSFLSPLAFVGEAPGFNEDQQGRPFCGSAGKLLDEMLTSINLKRSEVWIGNVLKCRPPENRQPMVDELRACSPYLQMQLKAIRPKLVVTLGRFALEHFAKDLQISKDHGRPVRVGDWAIYPLYHPAAALRSGGVAQILREEFRRLPEILRQDPKKFTVVGRAVVDENQISLLN